MSNMVTLLFSGVFLEGILAWKAKTRPSDIQIQALKVTYSSVSKKDHIMQTKNVKKISELQ